jgi:hypothetical protein
VIDEAQAKKNKETSRKVRGGREEEELASGRAEVFMFAA